jgi:2'-5' RNA ligase
MGSAATGSAIWLVPGEPFRARLFSWIERLSLRLGTPPFPPHVTLISGLMAPAADVLASAAAIARAIGPVSIRLDGVAGTDEYFRCLYARVEPTEALLAAHARAAREFGVRPDPDYLPHLSLVYGSLEPDVEAALARELEEPAHESFDVRRLHVWRTMGEVDAWAQIGAFDLGAADS